MAATRNFPAVGPSKWGATRGTNRTRSPFRATSEGLACTHRRGEEPRYSKVHAREEGGWPGKGGGGGGGRGEEKKKWGGVGVHRACTLIEKERRPGRVARRYGGRSSARGSLQVWRAPMPQRHALLHRCGPGAVLPCLAPPDGRCSAIYPRRGGCGPICFRSLVGCRPGEPDAWQFLASVVKSDNKPAHFVSSTRCRRPCRSAS